MARRAVLLAALLSLVGCVGGAPDPPRYFQPLVPSRPAKSAAGERTLLHLDPVHSATHLKDRIVWRKSDEELGFYEEELWTELPAVYLERALASELYERRPFRRAGRSAPFTLAIDLRAFEEVLLPDHRVRIRATVVLVGGDQIGVLEKTFEVTEAVQGENPEAMARAMGTALDSLVQDIATAVEAAAGV